MMDSDTFTVKLVNIVLNSTKRETADIPPAMTIPFPVIPCA